MFECREQCEGRSWPVIMSVAPCAAIMCLRPTNDELYIGSTVECRALIKIWRHDVLDEIPDKFFALSIFIH